MRHNSEVVEIDPDRFIVVHVDDYNEPQARPLEDVRDQIANRLAAERAEDPHDEQGAGDYCASRIG